MANVRYFGLVAQAAKDVVHNLVLVVPFLLMWAVLAVIMGFVFLVGFSLLFFSIMGSAAESSSIDMGIVIAAIIAGSIFFLILMIAGSFFMGMLLGMFKELNLKNKITAGNMFSYGKKYFGTYFWARFILFVIIAIPICAFILPSVLLEPFNWVLFGFGILMTILLSIFIGLCVFFLDPIIADKEKGALASIGLCFRYFKKFPGHTVLSILLMFLMSICYMIVYMVLVLPFEFIPVIGPIISFPISLVLNLFWSLFAVALLFRLYYSILPKRARSR